MLPHAPSASTQRSRTGTARNSGPGSAVQRTWLPSSHPRSSTEYDCAQWYARELGWATAGTSPVRLLTGLRFDVLELLYRGRSRGAAPGRPDRTGGCGGAADAAAGGRGQRRGGARSARLAGVGRNRSRPVRRGNRRAHHGSGAARPGGRLAGGRGLAATPGPRREAERSLPALGGLGSSGGDAPDLVRLVDAAATECHRARLLRARNHLWAHRPTGQPLAFS